MKRLLILCILLMLVPTVSAISLPENWAYTSQSITSDVRVSSEITLLSDKTGADIQYVKAELAFVPLQTWRQDVQNQKMLPRADQEGNILHYTWTDPELDTTLLYQVRARMKTDYGLRRVSKKIPYPIAQSELDAQQEFLQFTDNINVNGEIRQLANTLKDGEDDLYKLVFKVSQWMKNNINYNLSFAESLEKPTDVLESRQGVCDEFTALFVSLLRSIDIPTKYVSGYAYTNLRTPADFGPHAWAEVYFPDIGWVPFDITYNQFGFVDAAHIKLQESFDSGTYSSRYEWRGKDVSLIPRQLEFDADVIEVGEKIDSRVTLDARFVKDEVGFGSYNLLEVTIKNLNNFYQGITVYTTHSNEMEYVGGNTRDILLEPYEVEKLYFTTKLSEDLDPQFSYTIPVRTYLLDGVEQDVEFRAMSKFKSYSLEEINLLKDVSETNKDVVEKTLAISCDLTDETVYINKPFKVNCEIQNKGAQELKDVSVCYLDACQEFETLNAEETQLHTFTVELTVAGDQELLIVAKNEDVSAISEVSFKAFESPKLLVDRITHPEEVMFDDSFKIDFLIEKESLGIIEDVTVQLQRGDYTKEWKIPQLTVDRRFLIDLKGHDLSNGMNDFSITISYYDENGLAQELDKQFSIELTNTTLSQRIWLATGNIGKGLSDFDLKVFIVFAFAFGGLLGFLLHAYPRLKQIYLKRRHKHIPPIDENDTTDATEGGETTEGEEPSDEEVDMEIEDAVYEVLEENEKLQKQVEQLQKEKEALAHKKKKKPSFFASLFGFTKKKPHKHKELKAPDKKDLKPPEKKKSSSIGDLGKALDERIKDGFEKVKDESEKLKKKGEMP